MQCSCIAPIHAQAPAVNRATPGRPFAPGNVEPTDRDTERLGRSTLLRRFSPRTAQRLQALAQCLFTATKARAAAFHAYPPLAEDAEAHFNGVELGSAVGQLLVLDLNSAEADFVEADSHAADGDGQASLFRPLAQHRTHE